MTAEQIHAIELIAIGGSTYLEVANTVGVSETTIHNWKRDKEFCEAVTDRAKEIYRTSLPAVQNKLIEMARKGDPAALRIYFDHMGTLEKIKVKMADYNISFSWNILPDELEILPSGIL